MADKTRRGQETGVEEVRRGLRRARMIFRWMGYDAPERWQGEDRPVRVTFVAYLDDPDAAAELCDAVDSLCYEMGTHVAEVATWERIKDPLDDEEVEDYTIKRRAVKEVEVEVPPGHLGCPDCEGRGLFPERLDCGTAWKPCKTCRGVGYISAVDALS